MHIARQFWIRFVLLRPDGIEAYAEWEKRVNIAKNDSTNANS